MKRIWLQPLFMSWIAVITLLSVDSVFAGIAVIANPTINIKTLTADEVSDIFLGKTRTYPNGEKVIPIDQGVGTPVRDEFYLKVLRKSDSEMKSYWSRIVFTGKGRPPLQQDGDQNVIELVEKNPTLIGYIDSKNVNDKVKVVLTVE